MRRRRRSSAGGLRPLAPAIAAAATFWATMAGAQIPSIPVALRTDHPDLSAADARTMTPAALGDALLAPGHPPVVDATLQGEFQGPPPLTPPATRLHVRLAFLPERDPSSGFCLQRGVDLVTITPGSGGSDTVVPYAGYRVPVAGPAPCPAPATFFPLLSTDRPRAFTIVRLLSAAVRDAVSVAPRFPVKVDDAFGIEANRSHAADPHPRWTPDPVVTDGRVALARLRVTAIASIASGGYDPATEPRPLDAGAGTHRRRRHERWMLEIGLWLVQVDVAGDRITGMVLTSYIPPPF